MIQADAPPCPSCGTIMVGRETSHFCLNCEHEQPRSTEKRVPARRRYYTQGKKVHLVRDKRSVCGIYANDWVTCQSDDTANCTRCWGQEKRA